MKPRSFFFHYNKPASRAAKKPVISVHWKGACHMVNNVHCHVPVRGRIGKRQPYFVMAGKTTHIHLLDVNNEQVAVII